MKHNDRFFSRSRKNKSEPVGGAPAFAQPPAAEKEVAPAVETVVTGHALLFTGAPDPMPIVDEQLFLSVPPQGGLVISPECVGAPLLVLWKSGEDWLVRRLGQEKLLYNGFETAGDEPILLWGGACLEVVGMSAFTFLEIREPVKKEEPAVQTAPVEEPAAIPMTEPVSAVVPDAIPVTEPAYVERPPFDWTPFFPDDEPETVEAAAPAEEPEVTGGPAPAAVPDAIPVTEPAYVERPPFDWTPFFPTDEPETVEAAAPAEEPEVTEEPVPVAEPEVTAEPAPFDWTPFFPTDEPETVEAAAPAEDPEVTEEPVPVAEPEVTAEPAPFDWTPFFPTDEPETVEAAAPAEEPEVIEEPVPVAEPEIIEETVPVEVPPVPEVPVLSVPATPGDALVLALEQLAAGDWEALQRLPDLLEQVDLYCWGGFNFMGIYIQPIPAVRPADWSGDADSLDALGWEPRPGMVIPVFTREEEAVKRNCPLGAFPSSSAAALFARFAEMGLDLEVDPFGERPVWVPAGAVRALSDALGGGTEKFRWIRRTLPW